MIYFLALLCFIPITVVCTRLPSQRLLDTMDPNALTVYSGFTGLTNLAWVGLIAVHAQSEDSFEAFQRLLNKPDSNPNFLMPIKTCSSRFAGYGYGSRGFDAFFESHCSRFVAKGRISVFRFLYSWDIRRGLKMTPFTLSIAEAMIQHPNFDLNAISFDPRYASKLSPPVSTFEYILSSVRGAGSRRISDQPSVRDIALRVLESFTMENVRRLRRDSHILLHLASREQRADVSLFTKLPRDVMVQYFPFTIERKIPFALHPNDVETILELIKTCNFLKINRFVKMLVPIAYHSHRAFTIHGHELTEVENQYARMYSHSFWAGREVPICVEEDSELDISMI